MREALDSLVDKLSRLPGSRLGSAGGAAGEGHALAQLLADAAAGVESRAAATPPGSRPVPWLGPFSVADQLTVTGTDLWAAAQGLGAAVAVWSGTAQRDLGAVLDECTQAIARLTRAI